MIAVEWRTAGGSVSLSDGFSEQTNIVSLPGKSA